MAAKNDFYLVSVEDTVIQVTTYLVRADSQAHAKTLVEQGMFAFESEREVIDTIESSVKSIEEVA